MKVRDQRRAALLESLGELLQESDLDSINIADISRRAGVTRSAFYFYFESKHLAVAALMEQVYDGAMLATERFADPDLSPVERVRGMVTTLFDTVEEHTHLFRAMLDARGQSPAVREMWDSDRQSFVGLVADLVRTERAAGRAPAMLLELNDRALERLTLGTLERPTLTEAVVSIWVRSIFATDPAPALEDT